MKMGDTVKILIAGDFCPKKRVEEKLNGCQYEELYSQVKDIVVQSDYSIINLECPIVTKDSKPIVKCGPSLKGNHHALEAVEYMGFNCVTLANNHFRDYGDNAIINTLNILKESKIDYVGGGLNLTEAGRILFKVINGRTIAIINCCEHEFSIATEDKAGSNPLNPISLYYSIREARKTADYVMVIVHGGLEGYNLPLPRMQETYRFFIDAGADAVVNHHQHCYSGYEYYKSCPIVYGLGNFSFDGSDSKLWTEGYMLMVEFSENTKRITLYPYVQGKDHAGVRLMNGDKLKSFLCEISNLNNIISSTKEVERCFDEHVSKIPWYGIAFEPWGKGFRLLRSKGLLPSLVSRSKWLTLADYMICETHSDCIRSYFQSLIQKYSDK